MVNLVKNEVYKALKQKKLLVFAIIVTVWVLVLAISKHAQINESFNEINGQSFPLTVLKGIYFLVVVLMTILLSEMITDEYKNGTLKHTLLRPVTRVKLLISKVLALLIFNISFLVFILLVSYFVGTIIFGWGNGFEFGGTKLSSAGDYIGVRQSFSGMNGVLFMIAAYMLTLFQFMATGMVILLISLLFSNSGAAIATSLALWVVLPPILQAVKQIRPFLLDSYFYFISAFLINIDIMQVIRGFVVIFVYGFIFLSISVYMFKKKDILA
jgi:ABC-2 type transport system permease protein